MFHLFNMNVDTGMLLSAVFTIVPLSLATMVEHIGDVCAISSTVGKNYVADPGLHRTLLGDGLATTLAALFGAPANTTYGENTGVLALSKVYDPRVIRIAACFAIALLLLPEVRGPHHRHAHRQPSAASSLVLYGMISAVGVRNVVENKVDFTNSPQRHRRGPDPRPRPSASTTPSAALSRSASYRLSGLAVSIPRRHRQ